MMERKPKTFDDLSQFLVEEVRRNPGSGGWTDLIGKLTARGRNQDPRCWLVWPSAHGVIGDFSFPREGSDVAVFTTPDHLPFDPANNQLAVLPGRWQLYHLWMAFSPTHIWKHVQFVAVDAEAQPYQTGGRSIEGPPQEGRGMQLRKVGSQTGRSRFYPEPPGGFPPDSKFRGCPQIVKDAWDHEHCEYCSKHIDPPDWCYVNPDEDWVCESCFEKYIAKHDLSFVDEL
ncbi:MAG TPA: hypothetical protein VL099_06575 [Candidatus Binatia bacterium]|nr:hypothetical protein [Candidatus Binatia bacterium]